jgi:aryl-alcohol dehydrogenase (NADP+)
VRTGRLGDGGPEVSAFGLGTMALPDAEDRASAVRIVHAALDAGVTLIDTADVYGRGAAEEIVGEALRGRRDGVVLATKFGLPMGDDPAMRGSSRRWIRRAVEDSLRRLRTDHIDLYQAHRPDPAVPIEETLGVLTELVAEGRIRHIGSSTFPAEQIVEAAWASQRDGLARFVSEQAPYSILARGIETAVLGTCARHGVGMLVWSPLNGGWLTGKYARGVPVPADSRAGRGNPFMRADDEAKLARVEKLAAIAAERGLPLTRLALAWALEHPAVTSLLIGPRTPGQLAELLAGVDDRLDAAALDAIDEVVAPGVVVDPRNAGWRSPDLEPSARRRG